MCLLLIKCFPIRTKLIFDIFYLFNPQKVSKITKYTKTFFVSKSQETSKKQKMKTFQIQTTTMCIICTGDYDESLTELDCHECSTITEIPDTLTNLTTLVCDYTKVRTIPNTLTNLTTLICNYTNVTTIPDTLTYLTTLYCHFTKVTTIPDTLTNLTELYCGETKVSGIPDTLTNLTILYCWDTKVTTIPDTLTNLTILYCWNTKVTTIPDTLTKLEHPLPKYNVKSLKKFQKVCKRRRIKKSNILFVMHEDLVRHIIIPML
jgi:Leucine-rich repeat (LRR) protein